jgi:DNA-directed RNA polymerase subunit F
MRPFIILSRIKRPRTFNDTIRFFKSIDTETANAYISREENSKILSEMYNYVQKGETVPPQHLRVLYLRNFAARDIKAVENLVNSIIELYANVLDSPTFGPMYAFVRKALDKMLEAACSTYSKMPARRLSLVIPDALLGVVKPIYGLISRVFWNLTHTLEIVCNSRIMDAEDLKTAIMSTALAISVTSYKKTIKGVDHFNEDVSPLTAYLNKYMNYKGENLAALDQIVNRGEGIIEIISLFLWLPDTLLAQLGAHSTKIRKIRDEIK